jgi:hypothetical protein
MAGKAKFDQEAAFKSIIGAGATEDEKKADKPAGKGRPPVERKKKRVSLALYPSSYGALQKIAYVNRQSASDIVSELIADYVAANAGKLKEYDKIKTE